MTFPYNYVPENEYNQKKALACIGLHHRLELRNPQCRVINTVCLRVQLYSHGLLWWIPKCVCALVSDRYLRSHL